MHIARKKIFFAVFMTSILFLFSAPTMGTRTGQEGELWLKWSGEVRRTYVSAYLIGFTSGFGRGCEAGAKAVTPQPTGLKDDPSHNCLQATPAFPNSDLLTDRVTQFYDRHPSDRDLYVTEVIQGISKGLSAEEMRSTPPRPK